VENAKKVGLFVLRSCTIYGTLYLETCTVPDQPLPNRVPLVFYRTPAGNEPVREWLTGLDKEERHAVGLDLMRAQWRWPVGMPLCRPMGAGLWEIRTGLPLDGPHGC
jgi:hypothetical protein